MINLRSDNRIEIKYLSDEKSSHKILQQINSSKYQFKLHHPDRLVNSIYFDTPQTKELTNSVEGNFKKRKFENTNIISKTREKRTNIPDTIKKEILVPIINLLSRSLPYLSVPK